MLAGGGLMSAELTRGKLLATRPDGAKLYQIEAGADGGTVQIVERDGTESRVMALGSLMAHSPYFDFIEEDDAK